MEASPTSSLVLCSATTTTAAGCFFVFFVFFCRVVVVVVVVVKRGVGVLDFNIMVRLTAERRRKYKNIMSGQSALPEIHKVAAVSNQGKRNALLHILVYIYIYYSYYATYLFECIRISHINFPSPMYTVRLFLNASLEGDGDEQPRGGRLNLSPLTRSSFPLKIQTIRSIATPTYSVFQRVRINFTDFTALPLLSVSICVNLVGTRQNTHVEAICPFDGLGHKLVRLCRFVEGVFCAVERDHFLPCKTSP